MTEIKKTLIKLINCPFLALSATVQNIDFLRDTFQKINPQKKIHYLEYNERSINQQRRSWNGKQLKKYILCVLFIQSTSIYS